LDVGTFSKAAAAEAARLTLLKQRLLDEEGFTVPGDFAEWQGRAEVRPDNPVEKDAEGRAVT
jgi:hypothetical protein